MCLIVFIGCGKSETAAPPGPPALPNAAPAPVAPASGQPIGKAPEVEAKAIAAQQAANSGQSQKQPDVVEIEGGSPFALLPVESADLRFAVVDPATRPVRDQFRVTPLGPYVDSTRFGVRAASVPAGTGHVSQTVTNVATKVALPEGFTAIDAAGYSPAGLPWRIKCDADESILALVPAGPFLMGQDGGGNASPQHGVYLDDFYIDVHEVSADQYERYREASKELKRRINAPTRPADNPLEPVLGVNWGEANLYTRWAKKELPTEAQWEKAARGPNAFEHPWGNDRHLWQKPRLPGQIDPVGSFPGDLSPFGVFDLAGNAREWCADWYAENAYSQLGGVSIPRNPGGPKMAPAHNQHVVRGGDAEWRVSGRTGIALTERPADVGFRGVLNLKPPADHFAPSAGDAKKAGKTPPGKTAPAKTGL